MTEVTRSNFDKILPEVFERIANADFVAVDCLAESTGFLMADESLSLEQSSWYGDVVKHQRTRSPLEFGIAVFKLTSQSSSRRQEYEVSCYNIPIYFAYVEEHDARQEIRDARGIEERLDIDQNAIEFMMRIDFNLNNALFNGTPFMNSERKKDTGKYLTENPSFMKIGGKHVTNGPLDTHYFPEVIDELDENQIKEIIKRLTGIGKFFDVIKENSVPVVGHNLLIKLIYLYKDFVEYLPAKFEEFLKKLNAALPFFYDTKHIAAEISSRSNLDASKKLLLSSTRLYDLYRNLGWVGQFSTSFHLVPESVYSDHLDELACRIPECDVCPIPICHQSGFDALICGILITKLYTITNKVFHPLLLTDVDNQWRNRLYLHPSMFRRTPVKF